MKFPGSRVACVAICAFVAPLKFGTPVIHQSELVPPANIYEWVFLLWPNQLLYIFVFVAFIWWILAAERLRMRVDLLFVLPLIFLATQALAALGSINRQLTADTLVHFAACVLLFYATASCVRDGASAGWVFCGLTLATIWICVQALDQRYGFLLGGFEQTRQFASLYVDRSTLPRDLIARMSSNRVFATFGGYPNALASYLAMVFVPVLAWTQVRTRNWQRSVRWFAILFLVGLMIWCLGLTHSRGGQLALAATLLPVLWILLRRQRAKFWLAVTILVIVCAAVLARGRGPESFRARLDYWRGAMAIGRDYFWTGTGPGTFGSIYPKYKTARTEEAQLAHNGYLQMWSDSGIAGFAAFALLWIVAVRDAFRLVRRRGGDSAALAICAGIVAWTVHELVDFDLFVPALAVPAFLFLGMLQGLKQLPEFEPATTRTRSTLVLGFICAAIAGRVSWFESKSLAANIAYQNAHASGELADAVHATNLAPASSRYQSLAGDIAFHMGNFEQAIEFYRAAVRHDRFRASYHWRLARALAAARGLNADASDQFREAAALNPTNRRYHDDLARAEETIRHGAGGLLGSSSTKD